MMQTIPSDLLYDVLIAKAGRFFRNMLLPFPSAWQSMPVLPFYSFASDSISSMVSISFSMILVLLSSNPIRASTTAVALRLL